MDSRSYTSPLPASRTSRFAAPPSRWEVAAWWMGASAVAIWCAGPFFLPSAGPWQFLLAGFLIATIGRWALRNALHVTSRRLAR